ncbi:co-chaperone GroES [archaeon]|jgi:chaperonin GroES|nr:co-chaperone GroES [archaeon]|tara:strand:- start:96 stop:362 length:267 start_codon:yes stop_codon:yes gene_type:complete
MDKVQPLADRVLIKPIEEENKVGNIIIPDTAKEKPLKGEVLAVGLIEEPQVKVGDIILFTKYAGTPMTIEGEDCLVMRESDLVAVINE